MENNPLYANRNDKMPEEDLKGISGKEPGKKPGKPRKKGKKGRIALIAVCTVLFLVLAAVLTVYGVFHHYFGMMQELPGGDVMIKTPEPWDNTTPEPGASPTPEPTPLPTEAPDEPVSPTLAPGEKDEIDDKIKDDITNLADKSDLYATSAFNIMLVGIDNRDPTSFWGNSDTMILVSINKDKKLVTMTSFLRDTYAYVPGYDEPTRLNHAYARGYSPLMVAAFKQNYGITIDRCVVANFYVVADFVEAIGGIDLELSAAEISVMNNYINEYNRLVGKPVGTDTIAESAAGTIHVNGSQALAYCRVRYVGTDIARTGRQRTVIMKALEKAKKMSLSEISKLAGQFLPRVATDLKESDCATLLLQSLSLSSYKFQQMVFPENGTFRNAYISGMEVLVIENLEANLNKWHSLVEGKQ